MRAFRITKQQREQLGVEIGDILPIRQRVHGLSFDRVGVVRPAWRGDIARHAARGGLLLTDWVKITDVKRDQARRCVELRDGRVVDLWAVHVALCGFSAFSSTSLRRNDGGLRIPGLWVRQTARKPRWFGRAWGGGAHRASVTVWSPRSPQRKAQVASYISTIGHELVHLSGCWSHDRAFKRRQVQLFEELLGSYALRNLPATRVATWRHGRAIRQAVQANLDGVLARLGTVSNARGDNNETLRQAGEVQSDHHP